MKGLGKKLAASVLAMVLVIAMGTQCFAATWGSYFGYNNGWWEGAEGTIAQSATGWTAQMTTIGYGGIWGGQVFQDVTKKNGKVDVKKGQKYTLSFDMSSSKCDKLVYIKIATGETLAYAKWIRLTKGVTYKFKETFTAKTNANSIYFGIGGEFGDRDGSDADAEIRYSYMPGGAAAIQSKSDGDPTLATIVTLSNYKLSGSVKPVKNKKTNIKNLVKYLKANGKITAKKSGFKCTIKRSGSAVVLQAVKGKKKVVNLKVKTSNYKKQFKKIKTKSAKKGAKALNAVLKANTGFTLKNIGR